MYDANIATNNATVLRTLAGVGATIPKPVQTAVEERDRILAAARGVLEPVSPADLAAAAAAAIVAGRDPAEDEAVQALQRRGLLASEIGTLGLAGPAHSRVQAALTAQADRILALLAEPAARYGEQVHSALDFAGEDPDDLAGIVHRGGVAVDAWNAGRAAANQLDAISNAWAALAALSGFASATSKPALRLAALTPEQLTEAGERGTAWDIARAGATIELADRESFPQRVAALQAGAVERERQAEERERQAFRLRYGGV